jgi:hypothetical protein
VAIDPIDPVMGMIQKNHPEQSETLTQCGFHCILKPNTGSALGPYNSLKPGFPTSMRIGTMIDGDEVSFSVPCHPLRIEGEKDG